MKKKAYNKLYHEHKSHDEAQEQEAVARLAPEEHEQRREQVEQTVYTVRGAEEGGVPESETNHMIDAALYVGPNRSITELFSQIEQRVHHLTQLHIQLHE